jgi:GMP synthase (glutamine-hydrolysing)
MKTALVIKHLAFEDLGNLEPILTERGYAIQYLEAGVDDFKKYNSLEAELLIVLGGPIGVYDSDLYPFLLDEIEFIEKRVNKKLPTLGICLGAQLIAYALGARVFAGRHKEIGWASISLSGAAIQNYFSALDNTELKVLHWHGDTFDLPSDATLLASTYYYANQAFSVGKNILALQFHLEVLPEYFERWLVGNSSELAKVSDISIQQLRDDAKQYGAALQPHAIQFWHSWLESLAS